MLILVFLLVLSFLAFWTYISITQKEKGEKKGRKQREDQQTLIEPESKNSLLKKEIVCEGDRCYLIERKKEIVNQEKKLDNGMHDFINNIPKIQEEDNKYIEENMMESTVTQIEVPGISKQMTIEEKPLESKQEEASLETIKLNDKRETQSEDTSKDFEDCSQDIKAVVNDTSKNNTFLNTNSAGKLTLQHTTEEEDKEEDVFSEEIKNERNYYSEHCMSADSNKHLHSSNSSFNESEEEDSEEDEEEEESGDSESFSKESKKDSDDDESNINSSNFDEEDDDSGDEEGDSEEDSDSDHSTQEGVMEDPILKDKNVEEIKEIGNEYFKKCDYVNAIYYYNKAIRKCKDKNTKSILYSNRAACNILLRKWNDVVEDCTKSINYNNDFVKSYLRRSKAYEQMEKYNDASNDLNKALSLDPTLVSTYDTKQKKLKIQAEEQLNKEKEEMVGKLKDFGNLLLGKVGLSLDNFEVQKNPNGDGSFNIQFKQNK